MTTPPMPPVPFADFDFTFDPALSNLFPPPPPLPSSADLFAPETTDLFTPSETTDLFGFLDNFNWEFEAVIGEPSYQDHQSTQKTLPPYSNPHVNSSPEPSTSTRPRPATRSASNSARAHTSNTTAPNFIDTNVSNLRQSPESSSSSTPTPDTTTAARAKPLLSTPQKRLNHIMSEQKRRNAIRDGYASLIALLAPAGAPPGLGMPTRGRPKGSGSRGKGRSKGKSGVLFRAVEYTRWLEESRDALRLEVMKVEAAAGIHPS